MKLVSVSVPVSLAERWSARAKLDRSSQADVLRDAIEAHHGELSELLTATSPRTIVTSGLFDRPAASTRERAVGVSLRLPSQNLDVIDALSAQHGAENRSQLLTAALTAYLRDTAPVRR
jgi:metal-responsive CopG/Arc/MetJ family transcriptional regulator